MLLRPGTVDDLPVVAEVMLRSRKAAHPAMPASVHGDPETRAWVRGWDLLGHDLWVAHGSAPSDGSDEEILGFLLATETWLDHLYVDPRAAGHGVGSALVDVLKSLRPHGFGLWVFESNLPAQRFYASRGFVVTRRTDGSENEERQPDLAMEWHPPTG